MTITTTTTTVEYAGNGTTTVFPINFPFFELKVVLRTTATGAETVWSETTHYTLTGGQGSTGTLTAVTAPATGTVLRIWTNTAGTQLSDWVENDPFPAATIEEALDRLTIKVNEARRDLDRTPRLAESDYAAYGGTVTLPAPAASKVIGWNSAGTNLVNIDGPARIYVQPSAPATTVVPYSLWIDSDSADQDLYQLVSSVWTDTGVDVKGATGATGAAGADGKTVLSGSGAPSSGVGVTGDFYIDTAAKAIYGPRSGSSWGSPTSLIGPAGSDGLDAGLIYVFNTATSGAPGSGQFLFNNTPLSAVTAIHVSDRDANSEDVSSWIATWDDSTNTANRGSIFIRDRSTPSAYAVFQVTGASADQGAYWILTVSHVASSGTLSGECSLQFYRSGDKGADGAGAGDVVGPASAADNNIATFNGSTGKLIKDSGVPITGNLTALAGLSGSADKGVYFTGPGALGLMDVTPFARTLLDDPDAAAARTTLNLGATNTVQFAQINVNDADTTISRVSAGDIAVEGNIVYRAGGTDVAVADGGTGASDAQTAFNTLKQQATDTYTGVVELATTAETSAGADTTRAVTPNALAQSRFGTGVVTLEAVRPAKDVTVGDGAIYWRVPSVLNGMDLVAVAAAVITAGTTGTTDVQLARLRAGTPVDMLSTKLTIDSGETDTSTAATPAVINTAYDDVATGDLIRVDVDAVPTTKPKGLLVELQFRMP